MNDMYIAKNRTVSRPELEEFIAPRHNGVLITFRADGRPQMSPVMMGLFEGHLMVSTYPERAKTINAKRNPQVSMCVLSDNFGGDWVQVDGTAEVLDMPEALQGLVDYYRCISGEHPDWDEYAEAMHRQDKSIIKVRIDSWGPVASGGFPARLVE